MKTYNNRLLLLAVSFLLLFLACSKEDSIIQKDVQFKNLDLNYNDNDLEEEFNNDIAKLGRVLFYDKELSLNSTVSCGSCHKQEFSFADNLAKSDGFLGGLTNRNTPTLINAKFNRIFFWDGRAFSILDAVTQPIFDHQEMGMTPEKLLDRLSRLDYYDELITEAYGDNRITGLRIQIALAEFVGSILSIDAEIDRFQDGTKRLSNSARDGMITFEQHCNSCHNVLSTIEDDRGPNNPYLGVSSSRSIVDIGLSLQEPISSTMPLLPSFFSLEGEPSSNQFIRIPTLRNIRSTAPYMHDGRFQTLIEVINHYNEDIIDRPTIDERLLDNDQQPKKLNLSEEEKENLIIFLETLSDSTIVQLEKYSDPFE